MRPLCNCRSCKEYGGLLDGQNKSIFTKITRRFFQCHRLNAQPIRGFRSGRTLKEHELEQFYSLTPDELDYINENIRGDPHATKFCCAIKNISAIRLFS